MKKWKYFITGCIFTAFLSNVSAVQAETQKIIDVVFGKVNLVVSEEKVDSETILYNGTTYIPLRSVSEVLGKEVSWYQETYTAYIDEDGTQRQEIIDKKREKDILCDFFTDNIKNIFKIKYDGSSKVDMWGNVILGANKEVKNLEYIEIGYWEEGSVFHFYEKSKGQSSTINIKDGKNESFNLKKGEAIVLNVVLPEGIPTNGIKFTDSNGKIKYFYFSENMRVHNVDIVEFNNELSK